MALYKTIRIGDDRYTVKLPGAWDALKGHGVISRILYPIAGIIADEMQSRDQTLEVTMFTAIGSALSHSMENPELVEISQTLLSDVIKNSQESINVDEEFAGRFKDFMALLTFAFKEQYWDFIRGCLGDLGFSVESLEDLKLALAGTFKQSEQPKKKQARSASKKNSSST